MWRWRWTGKSIANTGTNFSVCRWILEYTWAILNIPNLTWSSSSIRLSRYGVSPIVRHCQINYFGLLIIYRDRPRSVRGTRAKRGTRRPDAGQPWPSAVENLSSCPSRMSAGTTGSWRRPAFTPSTAGDLVERSRLRPAAPIRTLRFSRY